MSFIVTYTKKYVAGPFKGLELPGKKRFLLKGLAVKCVEKLKNDKTFVYVDVKVEEKP
jgi:hypothetical protein